MELPVANRRSDGSVPAGQTASNTLSGGRDESEAEGGLVVWRKKGELCG